ESPILPKPSSPPARPRSESAAPGTRSPAIGGGGGIVIGGVWAPAAGAPSATTTTARRAALRMEFELSRALHHPVKNSTGVFVSYHESRTVGRPSVRIPDP